MKPSIEVAFPNLVEGAHKLPATFNADSTRHIIRGHVALSQTFEKFVVAVLQANDERNVLEFPKEAFLLVVEVALLEHSIEVDIADKYCGIQQFGSVILLIYVGEQLCEVMEVTRRLAFGSTLIHCQC